MYAINDWNNPVSTKMLNNAKMKPGRIEYNLFKNRFLKLAVFKLLKH